MKGKNFTRFGIVIGAITVFASCRETKDETVPGAPPNSDFRLRSLLEVRTIGGRYEVPGNFKTAALIVRFFENGKQVGRGPLVSIPIERGILDCEFLIRGTTGQIFTPNMGSTDEDEFYEKVGKSWTNYGRGNYSDLSKFGDVRVLGFVSSGIGPNGDELAGTPDFNYHITNASHVVALLADFSEEDWRETDLMKELGTIDFGTSLPGDREQPNKPE